MRTSDHEEFGIKLNGRPSSDSLTAVPIKKRRFLMVQSPSSPSHISSSPANCDVLEKSLKPESSVSETASLSALETTLTSKGTCGSRVESIVSKDSNVSSRHEILPQSDHPGLRSNMTGRETSGVKELAPDNTCVLFPVTGSTQLPSAQEPSELPLEEGSSEGKPAPKDISAVPTISGNTDNQMTFNEPVGFPRDKQNSESFLVKQENLESCSWNLPLAETQQNLQSKSNDAGPKFDSAYLCLNRSNWDLNTTMDTWEGLLSNSAVSSGTGGHDSLDLGGMHNKRLELGPLQMSCKESDVSDATLGKCMLEDGDHQPSSSNLLTSINKGSTSEACLDLQLKPSFMVESLFSSSVKPSLSNCIPTLVTGRDVKAEPYEESCQTDNRKIEVGGLKSVVKHVKSEPGERQEPPKSIVPNDLKSECSRAVKSEPLEDQSQGYLRRLDSLTPQPMEVPQNVTKLFSKAFDSLVPVGSVQHSDPQMPSLMIPMDPSQKVGDALGLVAQSLIPCSSEIHHEINSGISQYKKGIITETSDSVQESLGSEAKRLNLLEEAHKMTGLTSEFPSEPILPDVKENMVSDCKFEVVAQMCCSDNLSTVALVHELHKDTFETSKVTESSEGNIELSAEVLDKPCGHEKDSSAHEKDSNSFQDKAGSVDTVPKQFDEDDGYEDGEVKDPALHGMVEAPCKEREENEVKCADSLFPVDVPIETPSHVDLKEDEIENQNELKIHGLESCDGGQCGHKDNPGISTTSNLHDTSADGVLTADSSKRSVSKTICKLPLDHLKYKRPERKPKFDRTCSTRTITKGCHDEISNQQNNAPLLDKVSLSPKNIVSIKGDAKDHANDKGSCSRIVNLNLPPDGLACRKPKSIDGRLTSSWIEKEGLIEKSFRCENSRFQRIRDEKYKYRSRIPEHARIKGLPVGRRRSDLMHTSRTDNQLNALHCDRNSDHEQVDGSAGARFPRPINGSAVAPSVASDGSIGNAGRMARKLMVDELQNLSPMSRRRRSSGGRGQIPVGSQMIRHPVGDISPNSYRREAPNLVLRPHEERMMRSLPDDMMVPPPVSRAYFQYERAEGSLIQRERRSLSPLVRRERSLSPMRRRVPSQFPSICSGSSPGSQAHPYHQWSPPRRLPDGFNGSPEIMARAIRPDRMRSPHQRPCFAEDMIGRRRDSPPYITQMPDHLVDMGPSREQDFPRPVRGLQRSIRRFETNDPREISEEYFRSLPHNQFNELDADVECGVDRSFNERQERRAVGLSRSFRQRHTLSGNDNESFRPNVAGGPSGPFRSSHEGNEGFPERGSPREYEGHIRNRLGGRLRGIEEQDDNYRYHGEPGWRDAGITGLRPNRRRLERH